ncbi:MAG: type II toxin-antitoxin system VapB family antitoxin [Pseudonocardia sp.]
MARTNIVVDDVLVAKVKRIYRVGTTREAVDLALRRLVGDISDDPHAGLLALRGKIEWDGDSDDGPDNNPAVESWLRGE